MTGFMKVTYYHTLYQRETTAIVDKIRFDEDGYARFAHMGHKEAIEIRHVRKIEGLK